MDGYEIRRQIRETRQDGVILPDETYTAIEQMTVDCENLRETVRHYREVHRDVLSR